CTDGNFAYKKIKISNKHVISKSETCLVESKNSIIRRRLARFHRSTSCYSNALDIVSISLLLLFNEKLLYSIID
ncbi:MAG: IS1 family transposase, partial [Alphaproteobacteria bacterium]|nr:IS1 family transposase [Alphaproteobacteria bacterium]